jgi:hypothetical protein
MFEIIVFVVLCILVFASGYSTGHRKGYADACADFSQEVSWLEED